MIGRSGLGSMPATIVVSVLLAGACQLTPTAVPAVLARADAATMDRVKAVLAKEIGRSPIQLGPGDLTQSPVVSVLPLPPGPLEDRSLAMPTIFRLEMEGDACLIVREDTGARLKLDGVDCRAAP
jgi:hypothetical protein